MQLFKNFVTSSYFEFEIPFQVLSSFSSQRFIVLFELLFLFTLFTKCDISKQIYLEVGVACLN